MQLSIDQLKPTVHGLDYVEAGLPSSRLPRLLLPTTMTFVIIWMFMQ